MNGDTSRGDEGSGHAQLPPGLMDAVMAAVMAVMADKAVVKEGGGWGGGGGGADSETKTAAAVVVVVVVVVMLLPLLLPESGAVNTISFGFPE